MKKAVVLCAVSLLAGASCLMAEPLVLQQADNVLAVKTLEVGLADLSYQTDETKITNAAGDVVRKITTTATSIPLFARYAVCPKSEVFLAVPYNSANTKIDITGGASTTADSSGLADPSLGAKVSILEKMGWKIGAAGLFSIPAGDKKFKKGFDITPLVAGRKKFGAFTVNVNLSYDITGEYDDENSVKRNPGDVFSAGAGVEYPMTKCPCGTNFIGEFVYKSMSDAKTAGATVSDSSGSTMDLILGARCGKGNLKTKLGIDLSLGEEKNRAYDYKIIAGVTYLVQL